MRKGFTLVELMIVLAIIAIVATLAIINMSGADKMANQTAAVKSLGSLVTAQKMHHRENATYDTLANLLDADGNHRVAVLQDATEKGYNFTDVGVPDAGSWCIAAEPIVDGKTGDYVYMVSEVGTVIKAPHGTAVPGAFPGIVAPWVQAEN